ncbi:Unknown protein sequence [Pseudomonas savastanoi pv. phaseolicola]|nr:Unknown protein sequence [Pseudomonas savastanoi pv. phaseolicola]
MKRKHEYITSKPIQDVLINVLKKSRHRQILMKLNATKSPH